MAFGKTGFRCVGEYQGVRVQGIIKGVSKEEDAKSNLEQLVKEILPLVAGGICER